MAARFDRRAAAGGRRRVLLSLGLVAGGWLAVRLELDGGGGGRRAVAGGGRAPGGGLAEASFDGGARTL